MILTFLQAKTILSALSKNMDTVEVSLDLGKTKTEIRLDKGHAIFQGSILVDEKSLKKIVKKDTSCFKLSKSGLEKIQFFSEESNKYYKLMPTRSWPTIETSGIRMHCVKKITPEEDTKRKVSFVSPCVGNVLDTCTGLGYTATLASKNADKVYTFEIDSAVVAVQKENPWSQEIFSSNKIVRKQKDILQSINGFDDEFFDRIIHDPPRLSLATLLYSQGFYDQIYRVMKKESILFHHTGSPGSKSCGVDLQGNVMKRLKKSGFKNINRVFNGVRCVKRSHVGR